MNDSINFPFSGVEAEPTVGGPADSGAAALLIGAAIISVIPSAIDLFGFLAFRFRWLWWWELRWVWGLHRLDNAAIFLMAVFPCCFAWLYRKNNSWLPVLAGGTLIFAVIYTVSRFAPDIFQLIPGTFQSAVFAAVLGVFTLIYGALWFCIAFLCMKPQKIIAYRCFIYGALWLMGGIYNAGISFFRFLYSPVAVDLFAIIVPVYCILTLCSFIKMYYTNRDGRNIL